MDELNELLKNTSITETEPKKKRNRNRKEEKNTLENYFRTERNMAGVLKPVNKQIGILKTREKHETSIDFDLSNLGDENDLLLDVSDILDKIVSNKPKLPADLERLGYRIETPGKNKKIDREINTVDLLEGSEDEDSFSKNLNDSSSPKKSVNTSCFFESRFDDDNIDLFERSMNKNVDSDQSSDEKTVEYEHDEEINDKNYVNEPEINNESDNSVEEYVPLIERLRALKKN